MMEESVRDKLEVVRHACGLLADRYGMIADPLLEAQESFDRILDSSDRLASIDPQPETLTSLVTDLTAEGDVETLVRDLDGFDATKLIDQILELKNELPPGRQ